MASTDRTATGRDGPSLKGQPALPNHRITEAEWQRERDQRDIAEGLAELGYEIETFHWTPEDGLVPVERRVEEGR